MLRIAVDVERDAYKRAAFQTFTAGVLPTLGSVTFHEFLQQVGLEERAQPEAIIATAVANTQHAIRHLRGAS